MGTVAFTKVQYNDACDLTYIFRASVEKTISLSLFFKINSEKSCLFLLQWNSIMVFFSEPCIYSVQSSTEFTKCSGSFDQMF